MTACTGDHDDRQCRFEGPTDPVGPVDRRRCLFRTSQTCMTAEDCPLDRFERATPCVYIYDPPISTPLTGGDAMTGACSVTFIPIGEPGENSIGGTLNMRTGELALSDLNVLLAFNSNPDVGGFNGLCAECVGDPTPNDGVKGGRCELTTHFEDPSQRQFRRDGSADLAAPCDANRSSRLPHYEGTYSMDCSPTFIASESSARRPIDFGGSFSSLGLRVSIDGQSPDCSGPGFAGQKCFCAMCSDKVTPCSSNADCNGGTCGALPADCDPNPFPLDVEGDPDPSFNPAFAIGQCRADPYQNLAQEDDNELSSVPGNLCIGGTCDWNNDTGAGSCQARLPGKPMVRCFPSGLGETIQILGSGMREDNINTTYVVTTASARCQPATRSAAINGQAGLPALLYQERNFRIVPRFGEEESK